MELQVVLIGAVVFVISAVLIYLISAFTMKEKTFEEVIAEQKRHHEAELQKAKQDKKAEKEQRRKFKKKDKSRGDQSPKASLVEQEAKEQKMVNLEIEPEIIEPLEEKPLKTLRKREKASKVTSILHNKDEKAPVLAEENVEEIVHRGPVPMDDLELKLLHESKKEKPKKESKDKKKQEVEMKQPKPVVEEIMKVSDSKLQAAAPSSYSEAKVAYNKADNDNYKLISSVKSASLNEGEVQSLIDVLLNKQGGASAAADWNKKSQKGDPVALLRKQLEEKERSLQEEQQMVMAANTKLKEIKQELTQEKINASTVEKKYKEKIDYQVRETQAVHARLQHTHDQHMLEANQMRGVIQKLEAQVGDGGRLNILQEENKSLRDSITKLQSETLSPEQVSSLKQKVSIMEKELSSNAMKLNSKENAIKALDTEMGKLKSQLQNQQQQSNAGNVYEKRSEELGQELRKAEAKVSALGKDLSQRDQTVDTVHKECAALKAQLQELQKSLTDSDMSARSMEERLKEADRHKIDMEGNLKNLQKKIDNYNVEKSEILTEVQTLKQENSNIVTELKTVKEQQQTAAPPNGHMEEEPKEPSITKAEHEKIVADKEGKLTQMVSEVESKKKELTSLQQDIEIQRKKNNELREKNWKAMDALEKSEKSVSEKVQSAIKEAGDETSAKVFEVEKNDKAVLQRLYPKVSASSKNHKDWMAEFEREASRQQERASNQKGASDSSAKVKELELKTSQLENQLSAARDSTSKSETNLEEKEATVVRLQGQVTQYRDVLGETENKLTQLENSVESEEKKWQERIQAKDMELQQSQQELSNLRQEISKSTGVEEDDISDVGFAYRCVEKSLAGIVDEMKAKVETLESQLTTSNSKCGQLETQIKETESKVVEYKVQIEELQKSSSSATDLSKDLDDFRKQYEAEKKKNKDLASQIVRLNGTIKTGYDALTQEQQLVEKLKQQLAETGGQNSTSVPNDSNTEAKKLRTRLEEKEKQLEKEISSNKLLSQRLAASQSSLNETEGGTSV